MTDNKDGTPEFLTKSDFTVLLAAFEQKLTESRTAERADLLKEFDIRENKIHSSYKTQLKKMGVDLDDDSSSGKRSKNTESDEAIQKLLKRAEDADARAAESEAKAVMAGHRNKATEVLIKAGFNPKAVETVHTILDSKKSLTADGKIKVNVDGAEVALPMEQAVKYLVKSPEMEFFLDPKTAGGGTKTPNATDSSKVATDGNRRLPKVDVDWVSVNRDMHGGDGDGTTAPPFNTR